MGNLPILAKAMLFASPSVTVSGQVVTTDRAILCDNM